MVRNAKKNVTSEKGTNYCDRGRITNSLCIFKRFGNIFFRQILPSFIFESFLPCNLQGGFFAIEFYESLLLPKFFRKPTHYVSCPRL